MVPKEGADEPCVTVMKPSSSGCSAASLARRSDSASSSSKAAMAALHISSSF